jgi:hypothetical protein
MKIFTSLEIQIGAFRLWSFGTSLVFPNNVGFRFWKFKCRFCGLATSLHLDFGSQTIEDWRADHHEPELWGNCNDFFEQV